MFVLHLQNQLTPELTPEIARTLLIKIRIYPFGGACIETGGQLRGSWSGAR